MKKVIVLSILGLAAVGCTPAEYICPGGLVPGGYTRHTDYELRAEGKPVEVHTSDLTCRAFKETRK